MNDKKEKIKKKSNLVVSIVLICIIILLIVILVIFNLNKDNVQKFYIDYLSIETTDYTEVNNNELENSDGTCHISLYSEVGTIESTSSSTEVINDQTWYIQEFENGITLTTNYNNIYYVIQMYADDSDTYNNTCKDEFATIKKTFTFMKDE